MRCPFALWLPGPPEKTGYNGSQKTHPKVGVVLHTMEYESTPEWDDAITLHNALFSEREASWTFSICKFFGGALLFQHYEIGAVCWAQGYDGNLWLDSIETEGIAPGKFTEPQLALLVKTLRWIKEAHGWGEWVGTGNRNINLAIASRPYLFEHNAVPGAPATNCAVFTHGQVDGAKLLAALNAEEEDMDEAERSELIEKVILEHLPLAVQFDGDPNVYFFGGLTRVDSPDYLAGVKVVTLPPDAKARLLPTHFPDGLGGQVAP